MRYKDESIRNNELGAFLFLSVAALVLFEVTLRQISPLLISHEKEVRESIGAFENRAPEIELLFLGNSLTMHAINPEVMDELELQIHNFSYLNEPIRTTYWKLKYYLDQGRLPKLKNVFLQLAIHDQGVRYEYDYHKYYKYFDIIKELNLSEWYRFTLSHLYIYRVGRNILKKISDGEYRPISKYGFRIAHRKLSNNAFKFLAKKITGKLANIEQVVDNLNISYYKKFVDMLENHGIRVYLYSLPTPLTYKNLSKLPDKKIVEVYFEKDFANYFSFDQIDIGCSYPCFLDTGHLNFEGASRISQSISNIIKDELKN